MVISIANLQLGNWRAHVASEVVVAKVVSVVEVPVVPSLLVGPGILVVGVAAAEVNVLVVGVHAGLTRIF